MSLEHKKIITINAHPPQAKFFNQKSSIFSHALQEDYSNISCNYTHFHMFQG